jgi:hypothetical protein
MILSWQKYKGTQPQLQRKAAQTMNHKPMREYGSVFVIPVAMPGLYHY